MEDQVYNETHEMVTKLLVEAHEFLKTKYGKDSVEYSDAATALSDACYDFQV